MRRKKQLLSVEATEKILATGLVGVLGVAGDDDYPYTVPVNYVFDSGKIYFHSAVSGHKLDAIQKNNKVSFCVIKTDEVIPEKYTTHYRSAIVFGRARILSEDSEKRYALECLVEKYSPAYIKEGQSEIEQDWNRVCVAEVAIEHMTGKASLAFIN